MSFFKLCISVSGIYFCFITWGILQEKLTSVNYIGETGKPERFKFFVFLNTFQSFVAAFVAFMYLNIIGQRLGNITPHLLLDYVKVAITSSFASPFGYAALKHINYPTLILGKSCKLVPAMIMGILLHGKRYEAYKYATVALITIGVSGFMLFDPEKSNSKSNQSNSLYGIGLLCVNLFLDGATNAWQDGIFLKHGVKATHMMFFMNLFSGLLMILYLVFPGYSELIGALDFIGRFPQVIYDIAFFAACGALGQTFIFYTLENFSSMVLITITVTRKLFTILLSLLWFDHQMNPIQWAFVALVFVGIILEGFYSKFYKKKSKED